MPQLTIIYGALLIALGIWGRFFTGTTSNTALIPAIFGILFLVLGVLAAKEIKRKHVMHAAAALALLSILGSISAFGEFFALYRGEAPERPMAMYSKFVMCVLSIFYLAFCIRSFIEARRNRDAPPPDSSSS